MDFTFLNAGYLFAALAALVPLVIHLISRRKVETVDFSSLRFLKELERKRIRRVRIRQILLLIVRSLIILCAALALARPTLRGAAAGGGAHARTSVAIVIDDSASMSREQDGRPLFSDAVAAARGIAGLLAEGDQAFLVTAGVPPRSVIPGGTLSPEALNTALDGLECGAAATAYGAALALARDVLADARNLNREIYLVGDLQRTGWAKAEPLPSGRDSALRAFAVPLSGPQSNAAVRVLEVARKYGGAPGLHSIAAEIANHGRRRIEVPVKLFVDGEQVGQTGVEVEPGATAPARFAVAVDESSWHAGWVEIPADALALDNRSYLVIPAPRRTEVLVVEADGAAPSADGYYLRRALDPLGNGERFAPTAVPASALANQDRGRFPVVVLADVGRLDARGREWLERHAADGGGVFAVLGRRTDVRFWNAEILPSLAGVRLKAPFERPGGARIAPAAQGHPLLEGLVFGERLIDEVAVRRGFETELSGAEEVLEAPGIGPVLVLGTSDSPAAVLLTGVDPAWSDLPRSGLLVPLVHRTVERLGAGVARPGTALVGEDLRVTLPAGIVGAVEVELPGGTAAIARTVPTGAAPAAELERAPAPGVYRFTVDGREVALGSVSADPLESDLAAASGDEIEALLPGVSLVTPGVSLESEILSARRGRELWRAFLYAAIALVALEMAIARTRRLAA